MTDTEAVPYVAYGVGESGRTHRVLVVDDEPAVLFAYRKFIEREGLGVDTSTSLQGALEHLKGQPYLAVITDLRLGGSDNMDGLEVLRLIRQERPGTGLICATGYGSGETEQLVRQLGAAHYLEKPVAPTVVLGLLREMAGAMLAKKGHSSCWLAALCAIWC